MTAIFVITMCTVVIIIHATANDNAADDNKYNDDFGDSFNDDDGDDYTDDDEEE